MPAKINVSKEVENKILEIFAVNQTIRGTANLVGVGDKVISRVLKENGIETTLKRQTISEETKKKIASLYQEGKLSHKEMAEEVGISPTYLFDVLKRMGIKTKREERKKQDHKIVNMYQSGKGSVSISKDTELTPAGVISVLKRNGLEIKNPRLLDLDHVKKDIIEAYLENRSVNSIAGEFDCYKQNVKKIVEEAGIPLRNKEPYCPPTTLEYLLEQTLVVHPNKFSYDNIDPWANPNVLIRIFCLNHKGYFWQNPRYHIYDGGCTICDKTKSNPDEHVKIDHLEQKFSEYQYQFPECNQELFIKMGRESHGNYFSYEKAVFISMNKPIIITCPIHGDFTISRAIKHFENGGCRGCSYVKRKSGPADEWLAFLGIPNDNQHREVRIDVEKGQYYFLDGYDPVNNIGYDFYGDYWHGNPKIKRKEKINVCNQTSFKELYEKTMIREEKLKKQLNQYITIWESDWYEHQENRNK